VSAFLQAFLKVSVMARSIVRPASAARAKYLEGGGGVQASRCRQRPIARATMRASRRGNSRSSG